MTRSTENSASPITNELSRTAFLAAFVAFYLLISRYPDWAGISSYGNRFFVSLIPLFIMDKALLRWHLPVAHISGTLSRGSLYIVGVFSIPD